MIKYIFQNSASWIPYAMAGPSIGILTGAKFDIKESDESTVKNRGLHVFVGVTFSVGTK